MYKKPTLTCTSQVDPQIIVDPVRAETERVSYQIVEMSPPSQNPTIPDYQYYYYDDDDDDDVATWEHLEDIRPTTNTSDDSDKGTNESDNDDLPRASHIEDISGRNVDTAYGRHSAWAAGVRVKRWFGRGQNSRHEKRR